MSKKYIHVNQGKIRSNLKHGTNDAVITIKEGRTNTYCHEVDIKGPSTVVYGWKGEKLLPCGARVVIETESDIEIVR
jgi:hypothetical protein|tara:strand:- start:5969 stop:6199 length:231 start_codon:yes stop_codon:yes gene_type:complete